MGPKDPIAPKGKVVGIPLQASLPKLGLGLMLARVQDFLLSLVSGHPQKAILGLSQRDNKAV